MRQPGPGRMRSSVDGWGFACPPTKQVAMVVQAVSDPGGTADAVAWIATRAVAIQAEGRGGLNVTVAAVPTYTTTGVAETVPPRQTT